MEHKLPLWCQERWEHSLLASCWCHLLTNRDLLPCSGSQTQTTQGKMIWDFKACSICKINGTTVQAQWTVVPLTFLHFSSFRIWSYSCYPAHLKKCIYWSIYQGGEISLILTLTLPQAWGPWTRTVFGYQDSRLMRGFAKLSQLLSNQSRPQPEAAIWEALGQPQPGHQALPWVWGQAKARPGPWPGRVGFREQRHHWVRGRQPRGLRAHAIDKQLNLWCATL